MVFFKYAVREIIKTYIVSILLVIQVATCTVMIYNGVAMRSYFHEETKAMNTIEGGRDIHGIFLKNGQEVYMQRNCKDTDKVISYMKKISGAKTAYVGIIQAQFKSFKGDEPFRKKVKFGCDPPSNGYINVNSIRVGETFFDALNIKVSEGNISNLFKATDGQVPVILGNNYKKIYSIGSIIDGKKEENVKYKVVGFLDKNQYFTLNGNNFNGNFIESMDTFVVLPAEKEDENRDINSYLLTFNKNSNNKQKVFNSIINEGNKYDIQISFVDNTDEIKSYNKIMKYNTNVNRLFLGIVMIFVIVGTLVVFINKIVLRTKEFGVHIMSGASLRDIGLSIFFEFMIISILALILALGYLQFNNVVIDLMTIKFNWIYFSITVVLVLIFMALLSIIPIKKILNVDINSLVRSEE